MAVILVPVEAGSAVNRGAGALTVNRIPVEVVRALHRAADALADVSVQVVARVASFRWVAALATASLSVPEEVSRAVVGRLWLLADAAADSCVEVMGSWALVRLAQAAAGI